MIQYRASSAENRHSWKNAIKETILEHLREENCLEPVVHFYYEEAKRDAVIFVGSLLENRDMLRAFIKTIVHQTHPDALMFASEAWMKLQKYDKLSDVKLPHKISEEPDRIEAVIINYEDNAKSIVMTQEIVRNKQQEIIELKPLAETQNIGGRLANFMPKIKTNIRDN